MRPAGLLSLLALIVSTAATSSPRPRFSIYWNLPDRCSRKMKEPDFFSFLDDYGIIRNTNGSKIYGDKIVIIYSTSFDHYARLQINETTKEVEPISGGIPQNQSFHEFFHAAAETIKQQIPDQFYDGPAILDFEEYRYLYQYNWGKRIPYRKKSDEYTALKYPNISMKAVKARSEYEFNKAARRTILGLLRLAKKLRPYAQWGYYLMPECSGHYEKSNTQCTDLYSYNEQMAVLFHESTAIFPSIYFHNQTPVAANYRATQLRLREARRFSLSTKGRAPIYAYTKFEYDAYEQPLWYYTKQDLCAAFQGAFEEGIQGLILWSPDKQPWADRCPAIKNYVQTTLGPVARNIQKKAEKCSRRLCSGRGSCLRAGDLLLDCKWSMKEKMSNMACLCDEGYFGQHCEFHKRASKKDPKKPIKKPILLDTDFTTTAVSPTSERPETLFSSTLTPDWSTSPLPPLSPKKEPSMNEILDSIGLLPPPF